MAKVLKKNSVKAKRKVLSVKAIAKRSTLKKSALKKSTLKLEVCHNCLVAYDPAAGHLNCVPVTERQLFNQFDEDLRDAYYLIKDRVSEFGDQRMYNNARASMFSRRVCYLYVRPKKKFLEVCFFLPKLLKNEIIHDGRAVSKSKFTHTVRVFHSDQIDHTILTWLREAFEFAV